MLIGIHGKIGAGKDTFGDYICKEFGFENKKFADKLKQITSILTNCPLEDCYSQEGKNKYLPEWGYTIGEMQQLIGTEAMRNNFHQDVWVLSTLSDYNFSCNWVITDVRFPNEAKAVRDKKGILVKIERDDRIKSQRNNNHLSEIALDTWTDWDYIVKNNSTIENLQRNAKRIIQENS